LRISEELLAHWQHAEHAAFAHPLHNAGVEQLAPLTCLKVKRAAFCD
jgi:hypothetical protein